MFAYHVAVVDQDDGARLPRLDSSPSLESPRSALDLGSSAVDGLDRQWSRGVNSSLEKTEKAKSEASHMLKQRIKKKNK
ncbi:hypothetical protein NL676_030724 [Syzygium grande]|nr:hypothetical protein NL676_030724 [Syzygium grande]